jgi:hypothetical protein
MNVQACDDLQILIGLMNVRNRKLMISNINQKALNCYLQYVLPILYQLMCFEFWQLIFFIFDILLFSARKSASNRILICTIDIAAFQLKILLVWKIRVIFMPCVAKQNIAHVIYDKSVRKYKNKSKFLQLHSKFTITKYH